MGNPVTSLSSTSLNAPIKVAQSATSRTKHIRNLIRSEPSIAPAEFLLPSLTQVSETVIDVTTATDPLTSRLFAFGTAADIENKRSGRRKIDVLAVVGGPAGEAVRIVRVISEQFRWLSNRTVTLSVPTIDETEQGWWFGSSTPIQQVCFSEEEGLPAGWLAIRCIGATSILRPLLRRRPTITAIRHSNHALWNKFRPSRLDANQIVHLNIAKTGGAQHIDVAFNPWNQRQFAVLDVRGHWGVWDIQGKYSKRNLWTVTSVSSSTSSDFEDNQYPLFTGDGWGSILWVDDTTTLVVASRSNLFIYSIESKSERFSGPDLGLTDGSDWILDVQRSLINPSHIFVLTSLCIYWLKLDSGRGQIASPQLSPLLNILIARRHFLSQEDRSLKMLIHVHSEGELMMTPTWNLLIVIVSEVMLHSSQTGLVTVFKFSMVRSIQLPQSISDPFVVSIQHSPIDTFTVNDASDASIPRIRREGPATMLMCPAPFIVPESAQPSGHGSVLVDAGVRFLKAFLLCSNLSVSERLYVVVEEGQDLKGAFLPRKTLQNYAKTSTWTMDTSFIVEDGFAIDHEQLDVQSGPPRWNRSALPYRSSNQDKKPQSVDFVWLAKEIETSNRKITDQNISAEDFVDSLRSCMNSLVVEDARIRSL